MLYNIFYVQSLILQAFFFLFFSHYLICHKNSVAKTLLRRADCLPSSLDSKTEERKYVFNVLKANGYPKTFLRNFNKPFTTSSTPDEREPATGFAVIPYIQVLRNPSREFLTTTTLKLLKNLFRRTDAIYSIPCNDCDNKYIGQTKRQFGTRLKERQKVIFFYKKEQSALSEHTGLCLETLHINSAHTP